MKDTAIYEAPATTVLAVKAQRLLCDSQQNTGSTPQAQRQNYGSAFELD